MTLFPGRTDPECPVCQGISLCRGGGERRCRKRDPKNARISLILDSYGGVRTVVGTIRSIKHNLRHDEFAYVVPRLIVHEPIAWDDIAIVIERARVEFEIWLETKPNLSQEFYDALAMYRLRCLEQDKGSFDPKAIVET